MKTDAKNTELKVDMAMTPHEKEQLAATDAEIAAIKQTVAHYTVNDVVPLFDKYITDNAYSAEAKDVFRNAMLRRLADCFIQVGLRMSGATDIYTWLHNPLTQKMMLENLTFAAAVKPITIVMLGDKEADGFCLLYNSNPAIGKNLDFLPIAAQEMIVAELKRIHPKHTGTDLWTLMGMAQTDAAIITRAEYNEAIASRKGLKFVRQRVV